MPPWQPPPPTSGSGLPVLIAVGGGIVTLLGVCFLLAARDTFDPGVRIGLAAVLALLLVASGLVTRGRVGGTTAPVILAATGFATLYVDVCAASMLHLVPTVIGLVAAFVVLAVGFLLARLWRSQLLAVAVSVGAIIAGPWASFQAPFSLGVYTVLVVGCATAAHYRRPWPLLALLLFIPAGIVLSGLGLTGRPDQAWRNVALGVILVALAVLGTVLGWREALTAKAERDATLAAAPPPPPGVPVWRPQPGSSALELGDVLHGITVPIAAGTAVVTWSRASGTSAGVGLLVLGSLLLVLATQRRLVGPFARGAATLASGATLAAGLVELTNSDHASCPAGDVAAVPVVAVGAGVLAPGLRRGRHAPGAGCWRPATGHMVGHVTTTLLWLVLLSWCLRRSLGTDVRAGSWRSIALGVSAVTILKLVFVDVVRQDGTPRIIGFILTGLALIVIGGLYAHALQQRENQQAPRH